MRCAIWYHLCNSKNVKSTHGGVLILVKLQVSVLNFTNGTKSRNASHIITNNDSHFLDVNSKFVNVSFLRLYARFLHLIALCQAQKKLHWQVTVNSLILWTPCSTVNRRCQPHLSCGLVDNWLRFTAGQMIVASHQT